ncbi:hypothetical protein ABZS99_10300 [Streptomyces sp. NPDC005463]|uniref:hypothetical protein n=1 Tax=Streptomyces sp. NPDC005463 TaxID=3154465 RepID=UPI0033BDFB25
MPDGRAVPAASRPPAFAMSIPAAITGEFADGTYPERSVRDLAVPGDVSPESPVTAALSAAGTGPSW